MGVSTVYFNQSVFFEVKAVTGALTLGTSKSQILGLLDVAQIANLNAPPQMHPPGRRVLHHHGEHHRLPGRGDAGDHVGRGGLAAEGPL
jgi:hypothetical protein